MMIINLRIDKTESSECFLGVNQPGPVGISNSRLRTEPDLVISTVNISHCSGCATRIGRVSLWDQGGVVIYETKLPPEDTCDAARATCWVWRTRDSGRVDNCSNLEGLNLTCSLY